MTIDIDTVDNIAQLAQLALAEDDKAKYALDMTNILTLVAEMDAVNTDSIEPLAHPFEAGQRLRSDQVTEGNQRDELQKNAPLVKKGLFLVPKVITTDK